jgi:hypothetical protein
VAGKDGVANFRTFLAIRLRQNPRHYVSTLVRDHSKTWEETLDRYMEVSKAVLGIA